MIETEPIRKEEIQELAVVPSVSFLHSFTKLKSPQGFPQFQTPGKQNPRLSCLTFHTAHTLPDKQLTNNPVIHNHFYTVHFLTL